MAEFRYPPSWYDDSFHLKVIAPLWFVILWSTHHLIFLALALFANSGEIFRSAVDYAYNVPSLASDVPGLLVLVATVGRSPAAGAALRWIWRNGLVLLSTGLGLQIGVLLVMRWGRLAEFDEGLIASVIISASCLFGLVRSSYARDLFAEYPIEEGPGKT